MDPMKYLFKNPALSGRLSRWLILLVEFDLKYVARKTIKRSIVSDFCAKNPMEGGDGREDESSNMCINTLERLDPQFTN